MKPTSDATTRQDGTAIRTRREATGLKIGQFAVRVKLHPRALDNIENNRRNASIEALHRIARELECDVTELLSEQAEAVAS